MNKVRVCVGESLVVLWFYGANGLWLAKMLTVFECVYKSITSCWWKYMNKYCIG